MRPNIRVFPAQDRSFSVAARREVLRSLALSDDDDEAVNDVAARLRANYPNAVVRQRDTLAALVDQSPTWYVYRDGRVRPDDWRRDRLYVALAHARELAVETRRILAACRSAARHAGYDDSAPVAGPARPKVSPR